VATKIVSFRGLAPMGTHALQQICQIGRSYAEKMPAKPRILGVIVVFDE
jgi:hypothetical protein